MGEEARLMLELTLGALALGFVLGAILDARFHVKRWDPDDEDSFDEVAGWWTRWLEDHPDDSYKAMLVTSDYVPPDEPLVVLHNSGYARSEPVQNPESFDAADVTWKDVEFIQPGVAFITHARMDEISAALDRAYEEIATAFNLPPDVLRGIIEKGPRFYDF